MAPNFMTDFRHRFSRGLAALLPTVLTVALIIWLIETIDRYVGRYVNQWAKTLVQWALRWETERVEQMWGQYHLSVVGFALAIVLVYIVGLFVASFIGRTIWRSVERLLNRLPVIRQVYPSIKQVTDFLILNGNGKARFSRVVAVEYPRKGIWSVGLVTSEGMRCLREAAGENVVTVFVPSSPTPITGYTITVRRNEVIDMPFTIDEALRFSVSAGVILPSRQQGIPNSPGTNLSTAAGDGESSRDEESTEEAGS